MNDNTQRQCSAEQIQSVLAIAAQDPASGVQAIETALVEYPGDARLHFLRGSLLIGLRRHITAHASLQRAVELDPDFAIARFQLGFFELTSGEVEASRATLAPLHALPAGHYLRLFAQGLDYLVQDRFAECIAMLQAGQAANAENLPLNRDMDLIIAKCQELVGEPQSAGEEISATSLLLRSTRLN